jgi:hypothetical protein
MGYSGGFVPVIHQTRLPESSTGPQDRNAASAPDHTHLRRFSGDGSLEPWAGGMIGLLGGHCSFFCSGIGR